MDSKASEGQSAWISDEPIVLLQGLRLGTALGLVLLRSGLSLAIALRLGLAGSGLSLGTIKIVATFGYMKRLSNKCNLRQNMMEMIWQVGRFLPHFSFKVDTCIVGRGRLLFL